MITEEFSAYSIIGVDSALGKVTVGRTCYIKRGVDILSQRLDCKDVTSTVIVNLLNDILTEANTLA